MRIIGMLPVYNEADVVGQVLEYLIEQGISLVVIDNGSTDGSFEISKSFRGKGVLHLEQIPTRVFKFRWMLRRLYVTALRYHPEWALLGSADEFLESPWQGMTLAEAVELEAERGYNVIQFDRFEFWPTEKDYRSSVKDVRKRLRYYTWDGDYQFRCWKVVEGITVQEGSGHYPVFPSNIPYRVSPSKFVLRHYGIRSYEHGIKKIFHDRLPRYDAQEKRRGWHIHYDFVARIPNRIIAQSSKLTRYIDGADWNSTRTFDSTGGVSGNLGYYLATVIRPGLSLRAFLSLAIDVIRRRFIDKWGSRQDMLSNLIRRIIFGNWVRRVLFELEK
jgi:glycosyltransferase involved in cell wall biosynthesis